MRLQQRRLRSATRALIGLWLVGIGSVGCGSARPSAGGSFAFDHAPRAVTALHVAGTVDVRIEDARTEVAEEGKPGCYLGTYYAETGLPADLLHGPDCVPLADALQRDLAEELSELGFAPGGGGATLWVTLHDWNYDGFHTGLAVYDVTVRILDAEGRAVAEVAVYDTRMLPEARTRESRDQARAHLPLFYDALVDATLRHNEIVLAALRAGE